MLRARIYLIVVCLVAVVAATGWLASNRAVAELETIATSQTTAAVASAVVTERLRGHSNAAQVGALAIDPGLRDAIVCPASRAELDAQAAAARAAIDPSTGQPAASAPTAPTCQQTRHEAVLAALNTWLDARRPIFEQNAEMSLADREPGFVFARVPDVVIVADADGVVVARHGADWQTWFGPDKPSMARFGLVTRVETGGTQAGYIVWRENPSAQPDLLAAAAAPVRSPDGAFAGSVLLGYFVTNAEAGELRGALGNTQLAYFVSTPVAGVAVRGESSGAPSDRLARIASATLTPALADGASDEQVTFVAALSEREPQPYALDVNDESLRLQPHRFGAVDGEEGAAAGFFVISSATRMTEGAAAVGTALGVASAVAIGVGLLLVAFALRGFMVPIEEVSRGVQEVIAGNRDYVWPVDEKSYLSDLSHSLNVMSARLQGRRDPDADDGEGFSPTTGPLPSVAPLGGIRGKRATTTETESD